MAQICEIEISTNFEPLSLRIEKCWLQYFGHLTKMPRERLARSNPVGYTHGNVVQMPTTDYMRYDYTANFGPVLMWGCRTIGSC